MTYLIIQMFFCLLLAFLLGLLLGWLLKSFFSEGENSENDSLKTEIQKLKDKNTELQTKFTNTQAMDTMIDSSPELNAAKLEVKQLKEKLNACEERCNELESNAVETEVNMASIMPLTDTEDLDIDLGSKPAILFDSAPEEIDDLKIISGVGKVLEQTLNKLGIYQYRQVAKFSTEDIAWVDEHLKFKGRIERDNWVDQAKELHKNKYGNDPE